MPPQYQLRLKQLLATALLDTSGNTYIQLTGLAEDGTVWASHANKWVAVPMDTISIEEMNDLNVATAKAVN
jgi:hypothetical protein